MHRYFTCTDRGLGVNFLNSLIYKIEGETCFYSNEHNEYFSEKVIYNYTKDWKKDHRDLEDHFLHYTHRLKDINFDRIFDIGLVLYSEDDIGNILYNTKKTLYSINFLRNDNIHQFPYDTTIEDYQKFIEIDSLVTEVTDFFYQDFSYMGCLLYQKGIKPNRESVIKGIRSVILGENIRGKGNDDPSKYYEDYLKYFKSFYLIEYEQFFFNLIVPKFLKNFKSEISNYSKANIDLLDRLNKFIESDTLENRLTSYKKDLNNSIKSL